MNADNDQDTIESFADDLRKLRKASGNPTLIALANATGISKTVLSDAFSGNKLPTENTVTQLAEVLDSDSDSDSWIKRRRALDPRTRANGQTDTVWLGNRKRVARSTVVLAVTASVVVTAIATSVVWAALILPPVTAAAVASAKPTPTPSASSKYLPFADGVDPMQTVCHEDAVIAASEQRLDGDAQVQMMYSNECMGVWGRVTRYDGESAGNEVGMLIYPAIDMESSRNQERSAFDVQSIYTPLLIEPDVEARVCGIATITVDSEPVELGPPLCV